MEIAQLKKIRPEEVALTSYYYKEEHFMPMYKKLLTATFWVCPDTGEEVPLCHGIKLYYHHRLEQYRSFKKLGKPYKESHQTVADKLGLSYDAVRQDYTSLLKRMGLMQSEGVAARNTQYHMLELKLIKGYLINPKLEKHNKKSKPPTKKKDSITWEEYQRIDKNKKRIEKMRSNLTEDWVIMTKEDLEKLTERVKEDAK